MKKIIYLSFAVVFLMTNCKKEGPNVQVNKSALPNVKLVTLSDGTRTSSISMLEFTNVTWFFAIMDSLAARVEAEDDAFLSQWGYLSDSLLNLKEEQIHFEYQQPLIDFEDYLDFTNSMRQTFVQEEAAWLNHDSLDFSQDPSRDYPFSIVEMTLLNAGGEVKIGNALLKLTKYGFVYFTDGSVQKLIRFNDGDMTVLQDTTVITNLLEASRSGDCTSWKPKDDFDDYETNKRVKRHVHFHAYPWGGMSQAEITSYKKQNGSWKKYRIDLGVRDYSIFYDSDCNSVSHQECTPWKRKKDSKINKEVRAYGAFPGHRAKNDVSVEGDFEYANKSNYMMLSW